MTFILEWLDHSDPHARYLAAPPMFGRFLEWTNDLESAMRFRTKGDAEDTAEFVWTGKWTTLVKVTEVA